MAAKKQSKKPVQSSLEAFRSRQLEAGRRRREVMANDEEWHTYKTLGQMLNTHGAKFLRGFEELVRRAEAGKLKAGEV